MKFHEKIALILGTSGLTQEQLAARLGVSFSTINSWANDRSTPRASHAKRVDALCREALGQEKLPESRGEAKQLLMTRRMKALRRPLKTIHANKDIYDELMLQVTYNTNSIEGSTLTVAQTADVLFDNKVFGGKTLVEQMEVKNHQAAFGYLLEYLKRPQNTIDETLVLKLHSMLMNGIRDDAGTYRRHAVRIVGRNVPTANFLRIPAKMKKTLRNIGSKADDMTRHIAEKHAEFEQIHPFSDGNGRIGRLLMIAMALRANIAPPVVEKKRKRAYYDSLQKAQLHQDSDALASFVRDSVFVGYDILRRK